MGWDNFRTFTMWKINKQFNEKKNLEAEVRRNQVETFKKRMTDPTYKSQIDTYVGLR